MKPRFRSRSYKKIYRKSPGGRTVVHFRRKKPGRHRCSVCKKTLNAVSINGRKRPNRPFSDLCPKCMELKIRKEVRDKW
ncbi:MAG: 50S ribosomal protein L34e [Candidatus Hydrothermarchaeota archaeon]